MKYKPDDSHELEFSGRFYQNKLTRRKINSEDYYLKYKYTPLNELIDTELIISHGESKQTFEGDSLGWALRQGESKNNADGINLANTSRFSYGETDYEWKIGSKLLKINMNVK